MSKSPFQKFQVTLPAGEAVFSEGDRGTTMYIVQSGKVELSRGVDGELHPLGVMEKGDFFGEMSILEGLPRTNTATVVEDAELIEINNLTFDRMIKANIEIAIRLLRKLSIRLREAERRTAEMHAAGGRFAAANGVAAAPAKVVATSVETGVRLECADTGKSYGVSGDETLIGRFDPVTEQRPDVDLTEADLKRSVSRRHAKLLATDDGFVLVEEVGTLNGTFLNGERLVTGEPRAIADGDQLGFGMVKMVFRT